MNKLKFILTASIAAVLALSCSDGGDEGSSGGSTPITESFTLKNVTADQFTYEEVDVYDSCEEGGVLETRKDSWENTVNYSIKNNIMTWSNRRAEDTINFKGTSSELIGTWTRTKDKNASCGPRTEIYCTDGGHWDYEIDEWVCERYEEETWNECKEDYDITKAVFTQTTVKITRDYCYTDRMTEGEPWWRGDNGWKTRPVNCNAYEVYKGSEIVTIKEDRNSAEASSKGKKCKSEASKKQKENACKEAWDKYHLTENYWDDYYWGILYKDFYDCLANSMPKGFWVDKDEDSYGKAAGKPLAKAKAKANFTPLLKKRN